MTTTESGPTTPAAQGEVGRHLRAVRKSKGLSRSEVARSAGLTRRELAAYERGRTPVPDSDLWCLAGSCGVDVADLRPRIGALGGGSDLGALTVGDSIRRLRPDGAEDGILREYLAMIYELRNLPPGTRPPLRDEDLASLATALGGSGEAIEARLHELIGASREEAAHLRSMILAPRQLAAPATASALPALASPTGAQVIGAPAAVPVGVPAASFGMPVGAAPQYALPEFDFASAPSSIGDPAATARFFDAPVAEDPFGPPPPLSPLAQSGPAWAGAAVSRLADPVAPPNVAPIDPFAPPTGQPIDPFAGSTPPVAAAFSAFASPGVPPVETLGGPELALPQVDDIGDSLPVVDFGTPDAFDPLVAPEMVVFDANPSSNGHGGPPETEEDPFAALRMPIDESFASPAPPEIVVEPTNFGETNFETSFNETNFDETSFDQAFDPAFGIAPAFPAAGAPDELPTDEFAPEAPTSVVELPADTATAGIADPGDDWFDRAAAAADALIAEQRVDSEANPATEPTIAADSTDAEPVTTEPVVDVIAGGLAADIGLAPITWSVTPPAEPADSASLADPAPSTPEASPETDAPSPGPTPGSWTAAGPEWEIGGIFPATAMADDGTLALRRADVRWALADLDASGDFTLLSSVNFTSGAGFGILFRVSTDDAERITGYSFDIDPVYSGGGFLVRQWDDSRQHWKPLAHAPVADTARLYGAHVIEVNLRHDAFDARIDGEVVMTIPQLSRASLDAGHEPCRGTRVGVQAWSTTEVTVDRMMLQHH